MQNENTICIHCGAEIKKSAKACPECGSDEQTGWSEATYLDGIGLPDDDYEEIKNNEFNGNTKPKSLSQMITAIVLLILTSIVLIGSLIRF